MSSPDTPSPSTSRPPVGPDHDPAHAVVVTNGDITVGGDVIGRDKITTVTNNYFRTPTWAEVKHQRNRQAMIQNMRAFWIKGVLENSLYGSALIQLGLEYQAEAVEQPWGLIPRSPDQTDDVVAANTTLLDVFDGASGALLILGAPGAGKTTTLLELARSLLNRAEQDGMAPVPAVFALSAWANARPPLVEWLVDELAKRYDVPRKVGQAWVEQDMLVPLLDGLDEVPAEDRDACAQAINAFRVEHGLAPLVVCSRVVDYESLSTRLRLRTAIVLRPLTPAQVDQQLARLGRPGAIVRSWLATEAELSELAQRPLMLSLMLVALRAAPAVGAAAGRSDRVGRDQLFEAYVQTMLEPRADLRVYTPAQSRSATAGHPQTQPYPPDEARRWLKWLARQLQRHNQSVFYLEWMQPDWLRTQAHQRLALGGLPICLVGLGGLIGGLIVWLGGGLGNGLISGLLIGLIVGPAAYSEEIKATESLKFVVSKPLIGTGLIIGLLSGLGGLSIWWLLGQSGGLNIGLTIGLGLGLISGLLSVLINGLQDHDIAVRTTPNQGMKQSLRSGLGIGLSAGLMVGLVAGLVNGLLVGMMGGPAIGLGVGLGVGLSGVLLGGLLFGGSAYLRHVILRMLLWRSGSTPRAWEYERFLDYAAERALLRKVGGGYIFIHRMLMEWFVDQEAQSL